MECQRSEQDCLAIFVVFSFLQGEKRHELLKRRKINLSYNLSRLEEPRVVYESS